MSAPDLLALLREALSLMPLDGTAKRARWIERATEALAKAEGTEVSP